jgi:hypothetical protein
MKSMIMILALTVAVILVANGCRTSTVLTTKNYVNGVIAQEQSYSVDSGWHFWSEGVGKNITISPTVNGLQF